MNLISRLSLCAVVMLAAGGCADDSSPDGASGPAVSTPTTTRTATPTSSPTSTPPSSVPPVAPRLIPYAGGESAGVLVRDRPSAERLTGAPTDFKDFVGRTAERVVNESDCTDGAVGVTVEVLRTDGFAAGGVNDCGGYAALWAVVDGRWKQVVGSQEVWACADLERYAVPSDVAGDRCYDAAIARERDYSRA